MKQSISLFDHFDFFGSNKTENDLSVFYLRLKPRSIFPLFSTMSKIAV